MTNKYLEKIAASKKLMESARMGVDAYHIKKKRTKKLAKAKKKVPSVRKFARPNNIKT